MKKFLLITALLFVAFQGNGQTFFRSYIDSHDTVWPNNPVSVVYNQGKGALIACSQFGNPGTGLYWYRYVLRIADNGDTVWSKRNLSDTSIIRTTYFTSSTGIVDTVPFVGLIKSATQLNNGNYIIAATNLSSYNGYMLRQIDSLGNTVSIRSIMDSFLNMGTGNSIKVLSVPNTDSFYVIYVVDSTFPTGTPLYFYDSIISKTVVLKMDGNYNIAWSKVYTNHTSSVSSLNWDAIDVDGTILSTEGGLVFNVQYDTAYAILEGFTYAPKHFLQKLKANGTLDWEKRIQSIVHTPANTAIYDIGMFKTHDSSIVVAVDIQDSLLGPTGSGRGYLLKFSSNGTLLDTVFYPSDTLIPGGGLELSTGKYLFSGPLVPEFTLFDDHLNHLYSVPYPFPENVFGAAIPNNVGGAFFASQGGDYMIPADWHLNAVNFDSMFHCYPALVTGTITKDNNNDCVYNTGDRRRAGSICLHETASSIDYYGFCNDTTGNYAANVPYGNYTISHPTYGYVANECGGYSYPVITTTPYTGNDFYDTLIPGVRDLRVSMYTYLLNPGTPTHLFASLHNNGTTSMDTTFRIVLDSRVSYLSSVPAPAGISGTILTYNFHLAPDSFALININITPATTLVWGDTLIFTGDSPFPNNIDPGADSVMYKGAVLSSFDPNIKLTDQPLYFERDNDLVYTVCFQNTGNYAARSVVVLDTQDSYIDPSTLRILSSDHAMPAVTWLSGNRLMFSFKDIYLPDSNSNPTGSHACFSYSVKTKPTAANGDTIHNTAYIFFDYNTPVVTNTTTNIIKPAVVAGINDNILTNDIKLYPNPTSGTATLVLPKITGAWEMQITDITGRTIAKTEHMDNVIPINITGNAAGLYIIKVYNKQTHETFVKKLFLNN